jgi:hypothetical protein
MGYAANMIDLGAALGIPRAVTSRWVTMLAAACVVFVSVASWEHSPEAVHVQALKPPRACHMRALLFPLMPHTHLLPCQGLQASIVCACHLWLVPPSQRSTVPLVPLGLLSCCVLPLQPRLLLPRLSNASPVVCVCASVAPAVLNDPSPSLVALNVSCTPPSACRRVVPVCPSVGSDSNTMCACMMTRGRCVVFRLLLFCLAAGIRRMACRCASILSRHTSMSLLHATCVAVVVVLMLLHCRCATLLLPALVPPPLRIWGGCPFW